MATQAVPTATKHSSLALVRGGSLDVVVNRQHPDLLNVELGVDRLKFNFVGGLQGPIAMVWYLHDNAVVQHGGGITRDTLASYLTGITGRLREKHYDFELPPALVERAVSEGYAFFDRFGKPREP